MSHQPHNRQMNPFFHFMHAMRSTLNLASKEIEKANLLFKSCIVYLLFFARLLLTILCCYSLYYYVPLVFSLYFTVFMVWKRFNAHSYWLCWGKFVTIRQFGARDTVKSNQNKDKVH